MRYQLYLFLERAHRLKHALPQASLFLASAAGCRLVVSPNEDTRTLRFGGLLLLSLVLPLCPIIILSLSSVPLFVDTTNHTVDPALSLFLASLRSLFKASVATCGTRSLSANNLRHDLHSAAIAIEQAARFLPEAADNWDILHPSSDDLSLIQPTEAEHSLQHGGPPPSTPPHTYHSGGGSPHTRPFHTDPHRSLLSVPSTNLTTTLSSSPRHITLIAYRLSLSLSLFATDRSLSSPPTPSFLSRIDPISIHPSLHLSSHHPFPPAAPPPPAW